MSTMTSREAFEAQDYAKYGAGSYERDKDDRYVDNVIQQCWASWQAAIQHASDVAVKVLEAEKHKMGPADTVCSALEQAADAIKEALK